MITQLDLVLESFSRMDLERLQDLLVDEFTYADYPKEVFLKQLGVVFQEFKERDADLQLQIFRGACCSRACRHRLGSDAFRFFGLDGDHLDLRFILKNEKNGDVIIQDIYSCSRLISNEQGPKLGKELLLWFYEDDNPSLELSSNLLIARAQALAAEENWHQNFQNRPISLSEIKNWLMVHEATYQNIKQGKDIADGDWKWDKFLRIYTHLSAFLLFCDLFVSDLDILKAHRESPMEENALLKWILDVEERLEGNFYYELEDNCFEFRFQDPYWEVMILTETKIRFSEPIFGEYARFLRWFHEERKRLVKYYFALTAEEMDEFLESDPKPYHYYRVNKLLSYHLEIRNSFRKNGIFLPFGLGDRE